MRQAQVRLDRKIEKEKYEIANDENMNDEGEDDEDSVPDNGDDDNDGRRLCPDGDVLKGVCARFNHCMGWKCRRHLEEKYYHHGPYDEFNGCKFDWWICRVDAEQAYSHTDYAYRMSSEIEPKRGQVCHKIQRKSWGSWKTYDGSYKCVRPGTKSYLSRWGIHRTRRVVMYGVDPGNKYDWAAWNYG